MDRLLKTHGKLTDLFPQNFPAILDGVSSESSKIGRAYTVRERIYPVEIDPDTRREMQTELLARLSKSRIGIDLDVQENNFVYGHKLGSSDAGLYYVDKMPSWSLLRD